MKNLLLNLSLILALTGCTTWNHAGLTRKIHTDLELAVTEQIIHSGNPVTLQGYYADGASVVFKPDWRVTEDSTIIGTMRRFNALGKPVSDEFTLNEIDVVGIELWRTSRNLRANERAFFGGTILLASVDIGVEIACLINPKVCFGSCPTFYQNASDHLFKSDAEGFTNAILPSLEHRDIDALPAVMQPGEEHIVMKNEALETHNINEVVLFAVPKEPGSEVMHTVDDGFLRVEKGPVAQVSKAGQLLDLVAERDEAEWFELANEEDLAAKTQLSVQFQAEPGTQYGVKLVYRQTLMSTFLFYGTLENMGADYGRRMAIMNHSDKQKHWLLEGGIMQHLGSIEVKDAQGNLLGAFSETGPIAVNTQLLPIGENDGQLQIELTQGLWRIDALEIVKIKERVEPTLHSVTRIVRDQRDRPEEVALMHNDSKHLVSMPGDTRELFFEPLAAPSHVFLASKGFYLEWTRTAWNDEGNPRALRKMLLHPRQYLRDEAPVYKAYEAEMEAKFWASKIQNPILTSHEK